MCFLSSKRVASNLVSKQLIPAVSCHTSELSVSKYTMKLNSVQQKKNGRTNMDHNNLWYCTCSVHKDYIHILWSISCISD